MAQPVFYNADKWINAHRDQFVPPVCCKEMHNGQLKIAYVGGPNVREDFHIEEGEEIFYMVKGDMVLRVLQKNTFTNISIKEGEIFLLPARVAHSPQRKADTIGMLIERDRKSTEMDGIRWYVNNSNEVLYESWGHVGNLNSSIAKIIEQYRASNEFKTGRPAKDFVPKSIELNNCPLQMPFSLNLWLDSHEQEIDEKGFKHIFNTNQTQITIYGRDHFDFFTDLHEIFVWQLRGSRQFTISGKHYDLQKGDTLLIPIDIKFTSTGSDACLTYVARMKPVKLI